MIPEKIQRINELARRKKETGLSEEEAREQEALRREYLKEYRENLRATLDNVIIREPDGTQHPLRKKP